MSEFLRQLEEAAAICRCLAAEANDPTEAQAMREIVAAIEQIIDLAAKSVFLMNREPPCS